MLKARLFVLSLGLTIAATAAHAQNTRSWVSGVGDDVNPCSRTAPCKTWAGAISKTAAGGIIDALDSGGYGAVTITKAITLEGNGVLASSLHGGGNGIVINIAPGTGRNVILRNILIDGSGPVIGTNNIRFIAGDSLLVEDCYLKSTNTTGIDFEPDTGTGRLIVRNTTITQTPTGILVKPQAGATAGRASIIDSTITTCSTAALRAEDKSDVTVYHSYVSGNAGTGIFSFSAAVNGTVIVVDHSEVSHNGTGLKTQGGNAIMRVADSVIVGNTTGLDHAGGGTLESFLNNVFTLNSTAGTFTGSVTGGLQ